MFARPASGSCSAYFPSNTLPGNEKNTHRREMFKTFHEGDNEMARKKVAGPANVKNLYASKRKVVRAQ